MTIRKLIALTLLLALLAPIAAAATPASSTLASPCTPGAAYDPACDVDHDGDVDVVDVQLAAGHWNQSGVWTGGDFWSLTGNAGTAPGTHFLGTTDNQALELRVGGQRVLRLEPGRTIIGGYGLNSVTAGVVGATISGGGGGVLENGVTDDYGMVGGGAGNRAGDNAGATTDKGYATVGGGVGNTASGYSATVGGGLLNTASGDYAAASGGRAASAIHYGEEAHASGSFAEVGDAQTSLYVLRRETGDATLTELFLDGLGERITLVADRVMTFDILVVGSHRFGGGSSAGYQVAGVIRNIGGVTSFVGTPLKTVLGENVAGWDVVVEANDTPDALVVKVQGSADTTIRWVASARTVEVGR